MWVVFFVHGRIGGGGESGGGGRVLMLMLIQTTLGMGTLYTYTTLGTLGRYAR